MTIMTFLIATFGTITLAAYGIGSRILSFVIIPALGLSMATSTLVGQNIGANNMAEAVRVSKLSAFLSFSLLSFLGLIAFIFSTQFISFFIPNDPLVIAGGANFVKIIAIGFGFIGLHMTFGNIFLAAGKTTTTMILTISSQLLVQIPLVYFLSQKTSLGVNGIWLAFPITNVIVSTVAFILYKQGSCQRNKIIEEDKLQSHVSEESLIEEGIH
jgi:Na+-driven multidrug efflux pump